MNPGAKVATAVVGGYVLGRMKKARLAVALGGLLLGKRLQLDPRRLVADAARELAANPQLQGLRQELREQVVDASRSLATGFATQQAERLASTLEARTEDLRSKATAGVKDLAPGRSGGDDEAERDEAEQDEAERDEAEQDEAERDEAEQDEADTDETDDTERDDTDAESGTDSGEESDEESDDQPAPATRRRTSRDSSRSGRRRTSSRSTA